MVAYLHNIPDLSLIVLGEGGQWGGKQTSQVRAEIDTHDIHGCPECGSLLSCWKKGGKPGVDFLVTMFKDPDHKVRCAGADMLGDIGGLCKCRTTHPAHRGPLTRMCGLPPHTL